MARPIRPFDTGGLLFVSRLPPESGVRFPGPIPQSMMKDHAASAPVSTTAWVPAPTQSRRTMTAIDETDID